MIEFRHYQAIDQNSKPAKITIASGPVIIEDNKVLLDKHGEDPFWKFPGGAQKEEYSFRENAIREAKQELGIEVELQGEPLVLVLERREGENKEYVVLIHYLARRMNREIKPASYVREYAWHPLDKLPKDCAPNIAPVVRYFTAKK